MNEEEARRTAWKILGEFEGLLAAKGIVIPSPNRKGVAGEARLYGEENSRLEKAIVGLLLEHAGAAMTDDDVGDASHPLRELAIRILDEFAELLAEKNVMIQSDDREGREEEACLYGSEYYGLEDAIVEILVEEIGKNHQGAVAQDGVPDDAKRACKAMRRRTATGTVARI
jgi:hypothetical protein